MGHPRSALIALHEPVLTGGYQPRSINTTASAPALRSTAMAAYSGRIVEFHRRFLIRKLQHDDLVALERSFQHHRLLVGNQEPAFELAKHFEEARLVSVIKLATSEFELGDDVHAHTFDLTGYVRCFAGAVYRNS